MLVRRVSRFRASILSAIGLVLLGCHSTDDATYSVQRLALDTLFSGREHAQELVIWSSDSAGPALENILSQHRLDHARIDIKRLAPRIPAIVVDEQTLTDLFREHPDGWAEFFRLHPRSSGLVELSAVRFSSGNRVAESFVGRSCGEHCRNAWRVVAKRDASGTWKVIDLQWVRVPEN